MSSSVVPQNDAGLNEGELFDLLFRLREQQKQPGVSAPATPGLSQSDLELSALKCVLLSNHRECRKRSWTNCVIASCAFIISIAVAVLLAIVFYDQYSGHDIKQMFERQFKKHQQLQDSYRTKPNATEWRQCKGIDGIRKELEVLRKPPAFSCHGNTLNTGVGIIAYHSCKVKTRGMDASSGKFSVDVPGVYHLSFTGLYHAKMFHAEIVRINSTGETEYLGHSSSFSTDPDDTVLSTSTVIAMSRLEIQDVIYVSTWITRKNGESQFVPSIQFIGQKISD